MVGVATVELEETGCKVCLGFWKEMCKACNTCRGRADPRMHDFFTDSLASMQRRGLNVFLETVNGTVAMFLKVCRRFPTRK